MPDHLTATDLCQAAEALRFKAQVLGMMKVNQFPTTEDLCAIASKLEARANLIFESRNNDNFHNWRAASGSEP